MSITAKELAQMLHLSEAAVSLALNNRPGVSTRTRKLVMETAQRYDYNFSRLKGSFDNSSLNGSIYFIMYKKSGAVVSDTPFFSQLSDGINIGCRENQYFVNIITIYEGEDIAAKLSDIQRLGCKGIILLGTEMTEQEFTPFSTLSTPIVLLDTCFQNTLVNSVLIDNRQGAYLATNYLIRTCRAQPGYLQSSFPINNFSERADGFYNAVRSNGMPHSKSIVHKLSPSFEGAYEDMKFLLAHGETPARCYFADNDLIAAGAVRALKEAGFRIPKDIAVVGFDDMPVCLYTEPPLSTIRVPKQYMGRTAVRLLVELLAEPQSEPVKVLISTTLVKRKSV